MNMLLALLAVAFAASTTFYLVFNKRMRTVVLERLHFRRRRTSGARTPPRSLSPEKKVLEAATAVDYGDVFPPSRRTALSEIECSLPNASRKLSVGHTETSANSRQTRIPLMTPFDQAPLGSFTPTGFSVEEIHALGDFPDYATLSGVPLPQEYEGFDITKARSRPYRPFRWAYHQTMCKRNIIR